MSRKLVLFLALLMLVLILLVVIIGWKPKEDGYNPYLFGIHETLAYRSWPPENLNTSQAFEIMHSLGVRKLRMNIWRNRFMDWTNNSIVIKNRGVIDQVIHEANSTGIEIMGYAEDFPEWMTNITGDPRAVPPRDMSEGSEYRDFLEVYKESWETLAREFPTIKTWEIGNEYNLPEFLHPREYDPNRKEETDFPLRHRISIVTDLLYWGSQGIKAGNLNANRVMCGLGPFEDSAKYENGIYHIRDFLDWIYENITSNRWPSNKSDEFFQVACWHPYTFNEEPTKQNWVVPNEAVYDIMKKHGDSNKSVVFSEMGYSDNVASRHYAPAHKIAEYLTEVFRLAKGNFLWLDTIYWFRLTDRKCDGYGLVESPEYRWIWKPAAYAYQSLTHIDCNVGDISISVDKLKLLAPHIGLTTLLAVAVRGYIKSAHCQTPSPYL